MSNSVTVIGIDPGSVCTGWGIVRETSGVLCVVDCGAILPKAEDFSARIGEISRKLLEVLAKHTPQEAAVEDVFTGKSISSALKLGQARGAAVAACAFSNCSVYSYTPTQVKRAVVGVGRAEKEQVQFMIAQILGFKNKLRADTADALAVAICHLNTQRTAKMQTRLSGAGICA